jgi:hypothetical protein
MTLEQSRKPHAGALITANIPFQRRHSFSDRRLVQLIRNRSTRLRHNAFARSLHHTFRQFLSNLDLPTTTNAHHNYVIRTTTLYQCWLLSKASRSRVIPTRSLWYVHWLYYPHVVLIHQEGECKDQMMQYMDCLRRNSSTSTPCRVLSKDYLDCRMQK